MITCRRCQKILSQCLEAREALPDFARTHLHGCSGCRAYYEATTGLVRQMPGIAAQQAWSLSPFLHHKIMTSVRSQENADVQPGHARLSWAIMAGAACFAAAAIVWLRQSPAERQSESEVTSAQTEPALTVNLPSVAQVDQWTKSLDTPLERETQLVLSDANAAINTLARGLLPEDLLGSAAKTGEH